MPKNKLKVYLYTQVVCPKCTDLMLRDNNPEIIRCLNPNCALYDIKFEAPHTIIEQVKE